MVQLVDYSESSDDERDTHSDDGSQWSSYSEIPSNPSDSFSCPMRSPPSETSLGDADSVTSSVDTDDLDPDNEMNDAQPQTMEDEQEGFSLDGMEQEKVIDLTQVGGKKGGVFYAWKDLKEAFEENPFKRRSVGAGKAVEDADVHQHEQEGDDLMNLTRNESQQQETVREKPNLFDVEAEKWSFQATFAPGVAATKTRPRRRTPTAQHRPTGVSPRFSTLFTGDQYSTAQAATTTAFTMEDSPKKQPEYAAATAGQVSKPGFSFSSVDVPPSDAKQTTASAVPNTPDFTFGKAEAARSYDDLHMRSPSPRLHTASAPFVSVDGGFTIGRSGNAPKPYNFTGHGGARATAFSSKAPPSVTIDNDEDDTHMTSPSQRSKPASRPPSNGEFLFGQAYKNRKPFIFSRQSSNESFHSTESTAAPATSSPGASWGAKRPVGGTSDGKFDANREPPLASAVFTTGIAGPSRQHRNSARRKKISKVAAFVPPPTSNASASPFVATSVESTFGSSLFHAATATRQPSNTSPAAPFGLTGSTIHENGSRTSETASAMPSTVNTGRSFIFGSSEAKTCPTTDPSPFRAGVFGSASNSTVPATTSAGTSEQFLFGNGTSRNPFEFATDNVSTSTTDGFQIGSLNTKKNSRVRPRRSGMFMNKNSPRKDAKLASNEPEPSPGVSSSSPSTPSPFGIHNRRTRKNARLRQHERSPPADPFVTPTFQSPSFVSSDGDVPPSAVRPTAKKGILSTSFGAPTTSVNPFGSGSAQNVHRVEQNNVNASQFESPSNLPSDSPVFTTNRATQPAKSHGDATRPAFAGSRRILRAALRNVGTRGDRARSATPTTASSHHAEGDTEMDSEDEREWEELKRLGGVAHCSGKYEDAAEYYRQSIEVLDSLLYHDAIEDTTEIRTDKAKLHANRAASLMMLMQIAEAQHECRRSIEVDATYARAYLRLGRIQLLLGDTAHAQANLNTARQLMEEHGGEVRSGDQADHASLIKMETTVKKLTVLQGEIKWYVDRGDFEQALVHTDSALELSPNSRKLQVQKGQILLHQREFDQLVQLCTAIIDKQRTAQRKLSSPASRRGMNAKLGKERTVEKIAIVGIDLGLLWATTLHYQNKVDDAVRILNALEAVAPCSSHVIQLKRQWQEMKQLKHNGNERFKRGEYQEAVRFYSEAVQIDPQHQEFCAIIYCNRAAAQMGLERFHTAILDCNEALQRKPNYPRALLRRARCHVALAMYHEAVKDFDRYLRKPGDVSIDATSGVRRERNEAKAAIARAREEARQREATKKRAEREQRQRRQPRWEESSWDDSRFYENTRRGTSSNNNGSSYGGRYQSSGAGSRASFMAPKTQRRTHYDVLGIEKAATVDQIKKAYRKLALVYHPDKAKTSTHADLFKEMTAAYNVLSDEGARAKYDRELIFNRFGNFYEN